MSREWRLYVGDMERCCRMVAEYARARDFREFQCHDMFYDAVLWNLLVLGEASRNIPDDIRRAHPEIPWRETAGLRNVVAHGYFSLEDETLWNIVQEKLPALRAQLETLQREPS